MAVSGFYCEDNGVGVATAPALGGAFRGTTRATGVANVNWKSVDDVNSAYATYPVTGGFNSFAKYQFFYFSGTYNQVGNCLWQHVSGNLQGGISLKGLVSGSGLYPSAGPSQSSVALFVNDLTSTGLISTGYAVKVGSGGPEASGKTASTTAAGAFSEYFGTQIQTTVSAPAGDLAETCVFRFQFDES